MNQTLSKIGLGLAIALLLCLFPMPYDYYTLVRFASMIIFACFAFSFYKEKNTLFMVIAISLAILFQPLAKITLSREMWNIIDVIVAVALIALWWKARKATQKN